MRSTILFLMVLLFNVTTYADAYDGVKISNVITDAAALSEFEALAHQYGAQKCVNSTKCAIRKRSDVMFIKTSSTTIVGYTVQESYTKRLNSKTVRFCISEIHTSDLAQAASVTFSCQTEQN